MAIRPTAPDPSKDTVKCVTAGHEEVLFTGINKAGVCWSILLIALMLSIFASRTLMVDLERVPTSEDIENKKVAKKNAAGTAKAAAITKEEATATAAAAKEAAATTAAVVAAVTATSVVAAAAKEARDATGAAATAAENAAIAAATMTTAANASKEVSVTATITQEETANVAAAVAAAVRETKATKMATTIAAEAVAAAELETIATTAAATAIAAATAAAAKETTTVAAVAAAAAASKAAATATRKAIEAAAKGNATVFLLWVSMLAFALTVIVSPIIVVYVSCHFHQECQYFKAVEYFKADYYFITFSSIVILMLVILYWCYKKECCNVQSWKNVIVYPSLFIAFHHLLWVLLGIITEPFWAIPVLVAVGSVLFVSYFLVYEYYLGMDGKLKYNKEFWSFFLCFLGFLLLVFILLVVGQPFFSDSLIANVAQSIMMLLLPYGVSLLHLDNRNINNANDQGH